MSKTSVVKLLARSMRFHFPLFVNMEKYVQFDNINNHSIKPTNSLWLRTQKKRFMRSLHHWLTNIIHKIITYYFFVFTCKWRVVRKLQEPSTIHQRNWKQCFYSDVFCPLILHPWGLGLITWLSDNFWKPLFSKCFPSTLKCNAGIFKFPWFEDHFRKLLFSVRITVDDRPI